VPRPGKPPPRNPTRSRPPAGRPVRQPAPLVTPAEEAPVRHRVERRAAQWLLYLGRVPRWAVAVVVAALFLAGVASPGPAGAVALLALLALLCLLTYVTWRTVPANGRVLRVVVIAGLAVWAVAKLV
jgi:hypothetical protein